MSFAHTFSKNNYNIKQSRVNDPQIHSMDTKHHLFLGFFVCVPLCWHHWPEVECFSHTSPDCLLGSFSDKCCFLLVNFKTYSLLLFIWIQILAMEFGHNRTGV